MEKLLAFLAIRAFTHNNEEAMLLYNTFFSDYEVEQPKNIPPKNIELPKAHKSISGAIPTPKTKKPSTKKDELMESLNYLKNKKVKSVQDKHSISILEAVLKNMR